MKETTRDSKWVDDELPPAELDSTGPREVELVIVSLLMRLYDLNLALLAETSQKRADEVYNAHTKGEHFNPPIFVPEVNDD